MNIVGVIPARMGASRFPGKPLKKILGMPMVEHVYRRAKLAQKLNDLYVSTCDKEIFDHIISIGGKAVMTKDVYERPTERVIETVEKIEAETGQLVDAAIMIQGDEPMVYPENVDAMAEFFLQNKDKGVVNLVNQITSDGEYQEKDVVKLIMGGQERAIWFFRLPNPFWDKKLSNLPIFIQTGIIGFRRDKLFLYKSLESSPLEKANSVDMFRFIEYHEPIYVLVAKNRLYSVDTLEDLEAVEKVMKNDQLVKGYL